MRFFAIRHIHPYQPYATDFKQRIETFFHKHLNAVDGRTTVLFLGDGRNNYNASRADLINCSDASSGWCGLHQSVKYSGLMGLRYARLRTVLRFGGRCRQFGSAFGCCR